MECGEIPPLEYGEFSDRLRTRLAGRRFPLSGSLELTFRCNFRCRHCYVTGEHHNRQAWQELSTLEYRNLIDQMADEGVLWLLITGGEPLLRPDFREIYLHARQRGFLVTLFTNGTLLEPALADFLADWRPFSVEISLYGYSQATYERVTRAPGSHARCLRGLDLLLERQIPVKLKTMLMTLNWEELGQMKAFAESLGVPFRYDSTLHGHLSGNGSPLFLGLPAEQVVAFDRADEQRSAEWREVCQGISNSRPDHRRLYNCSAGLHTFHVDPFGRMSVCILARTFQVDLRRVSFLDGWRALAGERDRPAVQEDPCSTCDRVALCGQCPGRRQLQPAAALTGGENCRLAGLRWETFSSSQENRNGKEN